MYCNKCGNKLSNGNKFCTNCGIKIPTNIITNGNQTQTKYNKNLNSKIMLIMFLINYEILIISLLDYKDSILENIVKFIALNFGTIPIVPVYLVPIILCVLNIINSKKSYVIGCFICSILIPIYVYFLSIIIVLGNMGIFRSDTIYWIYIIQSLLLILTCLFILIFKRKE